MKLETTPPQVADFTPANPLAFPGRTQELLLNALYELDNAFGRATRAARASGELKLMQELEKRWDDYAEFLSVPLSRVPAKLFE